jgi:hypothetical protein
MTKQQQIKAIERKTGNKVYVGLITFDLTQWATVQIPGYTLQAPGKTAEDAVAELYKAVMK